VCLEEVSLTLVCRFSVFVFLLRLESEFSSSVLDLFICAYFFLLLLLSSSSLFLVKSESRLDFFFSFLALENLKWEQQRRKLDPSIYLVVLIMRIQFEDKAAAAAPPKR
jgi:hypothetical protein